MSRCELTGKKPVVKNLVSHSNIKTKSMAFPNVRVKAFYSPALKRTFRIKVSMSALRCVDKVGGVDNFLLQQPKSVLSQTTLNLRKSLEKAMRRKKAKQDVRQANLSNKNDQQQPRGNKKS